MPFIQLVNFSWRGSLPKEALLEGSLQGRMVKISWILSDQTVSNEFALSHDQNRS